MAANVRRLREDQNLNIPELGRRLWAVGHPMTATSITRLEDGKRRVDADDLVALAIVLGVTPNTLLLPHTEGGSEQIALTGIGEQMAMLAWAWANAENSLNPFEDAELFKRRALPAWLVEQRAGVARMNEVQKQRIIDLQSMMTDLLTKQANGDD